MYTALADIFPEFKWKGTTLQKLLFLLYIIFWILIFSFFSYISWL
jgi:hypothetical protein